jgi:hypothetical protein
MTFCVLGCSGRVIESSPDAADAAIDTGLDAPDTGDEAACTREADKLAGRFGGPMCLTTVRISQADFSVLSWQVACGGFSGTLVDEASAKKSLASYPKYVTIDSFRALQTGSATNPWIFGHEPGDFGGMGAVDARTGLPGYYANLSWSTLGDVVFPAASEPAPLVCTATTRHAYHVVSMGDARPSTDAHAMEVLEQTPILRGIERIQSIVGITLLHVPLDGSFSDPSYVPKNEWVALIESTLLE